MYTIRKLEERVELKNDQLSLKGVVIGNRGHTVDIYNNNFHLGNGVFVLDFDEGEYKITVGVSGVEHQRLVKRDEEDGGNYYETLQTAVNEDIPGLVPGKLYFRDSSKNGKEYTTLKIPFGAKILKVKK